MSTFRPHICHLSKTSPHPLVTRKRVSSPRVVIVLTSGLKGKASLRIRPHLPVIFHPIPLPCFLGLSSCSIPPVAVSVPPSPPGSSSSILSLPFLLKRKTCSFGRWILFFLQRIPFPVVYWFPDFSQASFFFLFFYIEKFHTSRKS